MEYQMKMPDLSAASSEVVISEWYVGEGEVVKRGQVVLAVETDKATMEVESTVNGQLKQIVAADGQTVPAGHVIAIFEVEDSPSTPSTPSPRQDARSSPVPAASGAARPAIDLTPKVLRPSSLKSAKGAGIELANEVSADRLARYDRDFLLELFRKMTLIRQFEDGVKFLFLEGSMPGTIHQCQGQEATAVGVCTALGEGDWITSTFRGHGHALAKGLTCREILFELFGASAGCCKGKGGSMHIGNMDKGMVPAIAIVGGSIPLAAGMALAFKVRKTDSIVACFFGDGATSEGAFHEGITLAAIWDLPVLFVCENNLYGASTHVNRVTRVERLAERATAYGIQGQTIDGNDVLAVYEAAQSAADECRRGRGPVLLEMLTYRQTGHSRRDAREYQPDSEKQYWFKRDPIEMLGRALTRRGDVTAEWLQTIQSEVQQHFDNAVAEAKLEVPPAIEDLEKDVYASSVPPAIDTGQKRGGRQMSMAEALREGIGEEMRRDPNVICLGEDIGIPGGWGGAFTVTLGLEASFPERMLNTPIAELGFFGAAVGAAMMGLRPIADVQYGDFLFLAMDQIVNNAAKLRYMSGGRLTLPMVMRAPIGATGRGAQHAQSMERYFTGVPGLKVVAVSNAYDAKGVLKSAVRDDNPVLIFEHKLLYGSQGARAESGAVDASRQIPSGDYTVPLDQAAVCRTGSQVTILGWLLMHHFGLIAAELLASENVDAEVIDVRSLQPIDYATIGESVRKTGRVVVVEEGPKTGGVSAEIAAGIAERFGDSLVAPVVRVASADVPVPFTPVLENAYRPDPPRIVQAVRDLLAR